MPSTALRSLIAVPESAFGSLGADGLPDRAIFDSGALAVDCDRASITIPGEALGNPRDEVRGGFYVVPDDPATLLDGDGVPVRRWRGQLTMEITVRSVGTAVATDVPFQWILASGLTPLALPTNRVVTVETEVDAQQFGVADAVAADVPTGALLAYVPPTGAAGPAAVTAVVAKASAAGETTIDYSPALPKATLEDGDTLRQCRTYGSLPGRALGPSVAFRGDGDGCRWYAFGTRLLSVTLTSDADRLRASVTMECAIIQPAHDEVSAGAANVAGRPFTPAGSRVLHALGARFTISDPVDDTEAAPRVGGATVVCPSAWSFSIENTLSPVVCWGSILGMTDMEVTDRAVSATATLRTPIAALDDDWLLRRRRTVAAAFGPWPGAGFVLPAAVLATDAAGRDFGGEAVQQAVEWRAGEPLTVTPLEAEGTDHLAGSPFLIGFALTPAS